MNKLESKVLDKYKGIIKRDNIPYWSFNYNPAIPFIGNSYHISKPKVLIYGSAENLSEYYGKKNKEWFDGKDDNDLLRNRYMFEKSKNSFFPDFHMQPIKDGSLLTVARYILERLYPNNSFSKKPRTFLEQVSAVNFAKFSFKDDTNYDYPPKNKRGLMDSFSYVMDEITLLKPNIIIIPSTILAKIHNELNRLFSEININPRLIGIYQVNPQAINLAIGKYLKKENLEIIDSKTGVPEFLEEWIKNIQFLKAKQQEKVQGLMLKYITWLDNKILSNLS